MRFNHLYETVVAARLDLQRNGNRIVNARDIASSVRRLSELPGFERATEDVLGRWGQALASDNVKLPDAEAFAQNINALEQMRGGAEMLLAQLTAEDSGTCLHFMLPPVSGGMTPSQLVKDLNDLLGELERLTLAVTEDQIVVARWEPGSFWLVVNFGAPGFGFAIAMLGLFYWWRGKELALKRQEAELARYEDESAFLKSTREAYGRLRRDTVAQRLASLHTARTVAQLEENVTKAIFLQDQLARHLEGGGRIQLDRSAEGEVRAALPTEIGGLVQSLEAFPAPARAALTEPASGDAWPNSEAP